MRFYLPPLVPGPYIPDPLLPDMGQLWPPMMFGMLDPHEIGDSDFELRDDLLF